MKTTGELEVFQFKEVVEDSDRPCVSDYAWKKAANWIPNAKSATAWARKWIPPLSAELPRNPPNRSLSKSSKSRNATPYTPALSNVRAKSSTGLSSASPEMKLSSISDKSEAVLPKREQIPGENYRRGDRIRAYIVKGTWKKAAARKSYFQERIPAFLINLFKTEVPEISEGIVKIVGAAREAGSRGKNSGQLH